MAKITTLGIDLAKNVFQLHGTDSKGAVVLRKRIDRDELAPFIGRLKPCLIGIEACGGAHYWARVFRGLGHRVKIIAPQFVKPYVKSNKSDRNDASAIAEAVSRPRTSFVPIKTREQQDILLLHRARELAMKRKIAQSNQIRGALLEYGITLKLGDRHIMKLPELLELAVTKNELTVKAKHIFDKMCEQFKSYRTEVADYEKEIKQHASSDERCQRLMEVDGVGPMTSSAIVATVNDALEFKNGREFAAWLGLVPRQNSSGDKIRLGAISKRGDQYLRKLLVHGARSAVNTCGHKTDRRSCWITDKKATRGYNRASVALANKNARIIWALLSTGEHYRAAA